MLAGVAVSLDTFDPFSLLVTAAVSLVALLVAAAFNVIVVMGSFS